MTATATKYDVGGVLLDRPFKIWRLGHFGYNVTNMEDNLRFYRDLLGFKVSDTLDFASIMPDPSIFEGAPTVGHFMRYGSDHHAHVLFPKTAMDKMAGLRGRDHANPEVTINQITWQVGSLAQVVNTTGWFNEHEVRIQREGRDMPGSNWHTYVTDPDGHTDELYYGIEQEGWSGYSKPKVAYQRGFRQRPELPQISELDEVQELLKNGVDLNSGYRYTERLPNKYDVEGVLLPRPFKITKIGPVNIFVEDVEKSKAFYDEVLGFDLTEEVPWQGEKAAFMRCNTEHHALGLFPKSWRSKLGLSQHSNNVSFGLRLGSYRQLKDAVSFLRENGVRVETDIIPPELHPGIDYAAYAFDKDGHALELYYGMEQIGWDGKPRPRGERAKVDPKSWPETLEARSDTYYGESFLGPWT
jgi:catechol 2,3-dioxygenase-like lactoylglutathione lyase family enzyme